MKPIKTFLNLFEDNAKIHFLDSKYVTMCQEFFSKEVQLEGQINSNAISQFIQQRQQEQQFLKSERHEFLFLGRSNVGKSSLLNALIQKQVAAISNYPGKTRNLYFYKLFGSKPSLILVDAPGYGFAKGDKKELQQWGRMMQDYLQQTPYLRGVFCLIDAEHGYRQKLIFKMQFNIQMTFQLLQHFKKPYIVCYTKIDKVSPKKLENIQKECRHLIEKNLYCDRIINFSSVHQNIGLQELRQRIAFLNNPMMEQN